MKYNYLIFDFDGTLADTREPIIHAYQEAYSALGVRVPTPEEITSHIGMTLQDVFMSTVEGATPELAAKAVVLYRAAFARLAKPLTVAFPGVVDMLRRLRGEGYRMSIASSRSHTSLEDLAEFLGVDAFFEKMCGAEDVVNHKPSPDMVDLIVDGFALDRSKVLVIGDATFDVLMAHGAGCDACAVTWGNQKEEVLRTVSPEFMISSAEKIFDVLEH